MNLVANISTDPARAALAQLIGDRGDDCASLSRLLGRNAAYVQQYLQRGTPRRLGERERGLLARYFGVDEALLGGPGNRATLSAEMAIVPRIEVGASAGGGGLSDEGVAVPFAFDRRWLRRMSAQPDQLAIIQVEGDSMAPTLAHGDDIMVDNADAADRLRDGIYVLRRDGVLLVKRLARGASHDCVTIISDNAAYPAAVDVPIASLTLVGRVIWTARRIG
jgi:phage repressor protein C with HTH and peptisase S24 domain